MSRTPTAYGNLMKCVLNIKAEDKKSLGRHKRKLYDKINTNRKDSVRVWNKFICYLPSRGINEDLLIKDTTSRTK
jgi:hypothetical protein